MGFCGMQEWTARPRAYKGSGYCQNNPNSTDIFDEARVDQAVAKMSLELQSALRDGGTVARMALHALVFDRVADNGALLAYAAQRAF